MGSVPQIAEVFGNESFIKAAAKSWSPTKGGLPLAAALGGVFLLHQLGKNTRNSAAEGQGHLDMKRLAEANKNMGDRRSLMGGGQLSFPAAATYNNEMANSNIADYLDFDKSAASARRAGQLMAKSAGIGGATLQALGALNKAPNALLRGAQAVTKPLTGALPSLGWKGKALAVGGAVGAGVLAHKASKKALEFGMEPAQERRLGAPGPGLPRYVNEYGVPTG
jgi:hypothetical protein